MDATAVQSGLDDDPARDAAGRLCPESLGRFGERVGRTDLGAQVSFVDEAGQLNQLGPVGLLDEVHEAHVLDGVPAGRRLGGDRDERPAGTKKSRGAAEGRATDGVENHVGLAGQVIDTFGVEPDEPVGAQVFDPLTGLAATGADHPGASPAGELHRGRSDRTGRAVDDHRLPRRQLGAIEQGLPGGEAGPGQRRGVDVVDLARFRSQVASLDSHVIGGRPVTELIGRAKHLVTDGDAGRPETESGDHPGDLVAGDDRLAEMTGPAGPKGPVQLGVGEAAGGDLDQHVARHGLGVGDIPVDQPADAARFEETDSLHFLCPFIWRSSCHHRSGNPTGVRSALQDGFDLETDRHHVADRQASALERHALAHREVAPADLGGGGKSERALPFVALGIAVGSIANSTVAYAASSGLWFALAALGGLWVPPGVLSAGLRHFAAGLPSYNQAALAWHITSGSAPTVTNFVVLAAWTVGLSLLPLATGRQWPHRGSTRTASSRGAGATAVELSGLVKRYGDVAVVNELDIRVPTGQIVALLGPNGAGKTTTLGILLGLRRPDRGAARLFGSSPRRAVEDGHVGALLQDSELTAGVRVDELLRFIRDLYPNPLDLATTITMVEIAGLVRRRTDRLSGGQARRVRFALAIVGNPALLVLDEPTAALDVQGRRDLWLALTDHARRNHTTLLFSTHYLEEADQHAERVVLVGAGRVTADGTPGEVKAAAGTGRIVRFRLLGCNPQRFATTPGVTAVHADEGKVSLQTTDADATIWALYNQRHTIADITVSEASLEEAFLSLVDQPQESLNHPTCGRGRTGERRHQALCVAGGFLWGGACGFVAVSVGELG